MPALWKLSDHGAQYVFRCGFDFRTYGEPGGAVTVDFLQLILVDEKVAATACCASRLPSRAHEGEAAFRTRQRPRSNVASRVGLSDFVARGNVGRPERLSSLLRVADPRRGSDRNSLLRPTWQSKSGCHSLATPAQKRRVPASFCLHCLRHAKPAGNRDAIAGASTRHYRSDEPARERRHLCRSLLRK
jgi:hypothetical protein